MKPKFPLIVLAASVVSAQAASLTWDIDPLTAGAQGGAGTWTNGTNFWWDGAANANWNNTTPDTATFAGTGGAVSVDAGGITTGGITVSSTGYSFIGTGTITLNGAVASNVAVTFAAPVALGASQTWTSTSAREITVNGPINLNANTLTLSGAATTANYRLAGGGSGTGGITKNGTGTLYMMGTHNHSGQTNVSSGYLEVSGGALSMANSVLNLTSADTRGVDIWAGKLTLRGLTGTGNIAANGAYNNGAAWWWTTSTDKVALSLNVPTGESYTFSGILKNATWAGSAMTVEKTGPGTQTFSGASTFSGSLIVNGGRLSTGISANAAGTASGLGNLTVARNITVNNTGTLGLTINNALVNNSSVYPTAAMVVNAGGKLTTSRFNIVGPINLNGGTVENTVASGTDNNYDGWNFAGAITVGGSAASTISSTTNRMNRLMASTTFNVADATGDATADLTVSAPLGDRPNGSGTGGLTKTGAGTLKLAAANTYTGATSVNAGTLLLEGSLKSPVTVADGAVLAISGTGAVDAAILVKEGGLLNTTAATGDWSPMNNRTLTAGRVGAAGTDITGNLTLLPGATLQIGEGAATSATLTSASGLKLDGGKVAFDLTSNPAGANDTIVLNGPLDVVSVSDVQFNLTDLALGNGVYPLVSAAGGITGAANITPLGLPGAGARQTFTLSTTTVPNTLTLDVTGSAATLVWNNFSGTGKWNTTDVNWKNGAVNDKFFNGDLVRLEDTANGTENIDIDTTVEGVAIQAVNTAATAFVLGGAGKITGSTSINLTGGGFLRLANTGGNDFTGAVTVENGSTLEIADPYALPTAAAVTLDGSTLDVGTTAGALTGPVLLTNGSTLAGTTGTLEAVSVEARGGLISANLAGTGTFAVTNNSTAQLESATALSTALSVGAGSTLELLGGAAVTGNIANSGTLRGAALATQTATVAGIVSGGGSLQQNGAGTLALTGAQTYSGSTTVNAGVLDLATGDAKLYSDTYRTTTLTINTGGTVRAGRINYGGANHLGQLTHNCPSNIINGGTLEMVSASDTSQRGWTIGAAGAVIRTAAGSIHTWSPSNEAWTQIDLNNGGAVLTFDVGGDFVLRSTIMDYTGTPGGAGGVSVSNGSVVKTGPGTLTFGTQTLVAAAGSHQYTGTTTVQQGTLVLDASLGTSPVNVSAGATLSIGTTLATVGSGPLTLAATSTLKIEGNSTLQNSDLLNIAGAVALNGATLNFTDLGNSTLTAGTRFPIVSYTGALTGEFAGLPEGGTFTAGSNTFKIRYADESKITLEAVSTGGYATWSAENAPTGTAPDDFDGDGVSNGIEYVLGGTKNTNDLAKMPTPLATPGGAFVFSFVRSQASKTSDTTVRIQVGTDLSTWPASYNVATAPEVTTIDNGNGTETVTLTLPRNPDTRKFARMSVEIN